MTKTQIAINGMDNTDAAAEILLHLADQETARTMSLRDTQAEGQRQRIGATILRNARAHVRGNEPYFENSVATWMEME